MVFLACETARHLAAVTRLFEFISVVLIVNIIIIQFMLSLIHI